MTLQIALATDSNMVELALVTIGSVLESTSRKVNLHLMVIVCQFGNVRRSRVSAPKRAAPLPSTR